MAQLDVQPKKSNPWWIWALVAIIAIIIIIVFLRSGNHKSDQKTVSDTTTTVQKTVSDSTSH